MRTLRPRALHDTDRPSATAQWTTFGRALEFDRPAAERIVSDRFAPLFLSRESRTMLAPLHAGRPVVRAMERSRLAVLSTSALCRHRFIDEQLLSFLPAVDQVLILGAGYDSRAYRFADEIGERPVFEVDLPPLSRRKRELVDAHRDAFGATQVESVEIDFRTQSLTERLADGGFAPGAPTFVAWEGVNMYLTAVAFHATLEALVEVCGGGSVLALDFWQDVPGRGPYDLVRRLGQQAIRLIGEPVDHTVPASEAAGVLAASGWHITDLADAAEMTDRYATAGRRCDRAMYVAAATP